MRDGSDESNVGGADLGVEGEGNEVMADLGFAGLTRRERLERIANAERDRRRGSDAVAAAAIGEPNEWPARAVLALTRIDAADAEGARRLLEEGLDRWAREAGLGSLEPAALLPVVDEGTAATPQPEPESATSFFGMPLARPLDGFELDRAFELAEAQTDEMLDANRVAERVLMEEPLGLAELSGASFDSASDSAFEDDVEMDAAWIATPSGTIVVPAVDDADEGRPSRPEILATLEQWLHNLERRRAGRAQ